MIYILLLKQACKRTLRQVGPLIGSEDTNSMFQNHLIEGAVLHYGEFINDLSKVMVSAVLMSFICCCVFGRILHGMAMC